MKRWAEYLYKLSVYCMKKTHPEWQPRRWSNRELQRFALIFTGDCVNVSGWEDMDKEGRRYREYFANVASYVVSNHIGARGFAEGSGDLLLNLEEELPDKLRKQFDVVFNHTTLEHVFDLNLALDNLCQLSRDVVILVVPFIQVQHWEKGSFLDFHRLTEFGVKNHLESRGFELLYLNSNNNPVFATYIFAIASRLPQKWRRYFEGAAVHTPEAQYERVKPVIEGMPVLQSF